MQKRVLRLKTDELQGEGSYVEIERFNWGEKQRFETLARNVQREAKKLQDLDIDPDVLAAMNPLQDAIGAKVRGWNWSDADGKPLPLPKDDPGVMDLLLEEEMTLLMEAIAGTPKKETVKN